MPILWMVRYKSATKKPPRHRSMAKICANVLALRRDKYFLAGFVARIANPLWVTRDNIPRHNTLKQTTTARCGVVVTVKFFVLQDEGNRFLKLQGLGAFDGRIVCVCGQGGAQGL